MSRITIFPVTIFVGQSTDGNSEEAEDRNHDAQDQEKNPMKLDRSDVKSEVVHICRHHSCLLVASRNLAGLAAEDPIDDAGVDQHDREHDNASAPK
jgi:hypothetical protein